MVFQATAVYPTGMTYLLALPSLLCGLAVAVEDVRSRRVPRHWIAAGCAAQLLVLVIVAVAGGEYALPLRAAGFAAASAALQCALALCRPGALGFGDVTCTLMMGVAVGAHGLDGVLAWWLAMGVLGMAWIAAWRRFGFQRGTPRIPFAPAIVAAAAVALAV